MTLSDWHVMHVRSSFVITDGWARPLGSPPTHVAPYPVRHPHVVARHAAQPDRGLEIAKAEIGRRIGERERVRTLRRGR